MALNITQPKVSFTIDWIVLIVIIILMGITSKIPPFERQFKLDDITISHPHKGDTVKMSYLIVWNNTELLIFENIRNFAKIMFLLMLK